MTCINVGWRTVHGTLKDRPIENGRADRAAGGAQHLLALVCSHTLLALATLRRENVLVLPRGLIRDACDDRHDGFREASQDLRIVSERSAGEHAHRSI
jgi:hypothetical protein